MEQVPTYFQWGIIQISIPNLLVILLMILTFVLALIVPFPQQRKDKP